MHDALAGQDLVRTDFRVPALAAVDLTDHTVHEVVARGKHMLTRLTGAGSQPLTLHTHFRMDGSWHLYRPGERWRRPGHQARLVLDTRPWQAVGFLLHDVRIVPTKDEHHVVGHLGPDLLGDDWDLTEAIGRLSADPVREIGLALLDQHLITGLGNLYRTEVLFLHGITPWTPVDDVVDLVRLLDRARNLMILNKNDWPQVTTGDARRGRQHWVFERTGRPCWRCNTPVRTARQGTSPRDRITYWCPQCQQGPGPNP